MLSHTVSYTIHVNIEEYIRQGLDQEDIVNKINELHQINFVSTDGDKNIQFIVYSEFYKKDIDDIEDILNTMLFNKKRNMKHDEQELYCCPHCGADVFELLNGYCMDCSKDKQRMVDHIIEQYEL